MKKTIIATLSVLVVVALALAIIPTTRDEIYWRWASHKDVTTSYESYLKVFPNGRHVVEAQARYDERGWIDAEKSNTIRSYRDYLKAFPNGRHVAEARARYDELGWVDVEKSNTIRSDRDYVATHP